MYTYIFLEGDECEHDGFSFQVLLDGVQVGHIDVGLEFEANEYGFEPYAHEPVYDELLADIDMCLCIQSLEIDAKYRNAGLGSELMRRAMAAMAARYPGVPCYLNASPMGNCMDLDTLVEFYAKFGFKMLLKYARHRNALLLAA